MRNCQSDAAQTHGLVPWVDGAPDHDYSTTGEHAMKTTTTSLRRLARILANERRLARATGRTFEVEHANGSRTACAPHGYVIRPVSDSVYRSVQVPRQSDSAARCARAMLHGI